MNEPARTTPLPSNTDPKILDDGTGERGLTFAEMQQRVAAAEAEARREAAARKAAEAELAWLRADLARLRKPG
jgi:hypothetical protein